MAAPPVGPEPESNGAPLRDREGRSSAIPRSVPDLMFLQTTDGVYIGYHASDAAELLLSPEQFLGRNMRDVLPPPLLQAIEPGFVRAVSAPDPVVLEYDLTLPHGHRSFEAQLVRGSNDQVLTLVRDVTDRKRAEATLQENAQRYVLATAGAVGVWDLNLDSNDLYVDATIRMLLGFDEREISNRVADWSGRVHPDDRNAVLAQARSVMASHADVFETEHRMVHKDGSLRWFLSHGSVMRRAEGAPYRMIGTSVDITERKRAADQMRLALEATTTGMLMVDGTFRIVLLNAHAERLFGYQRDELIDQHVTRLLPERLRAIGHDAEDPGTGSAGFRPEGTQELYGVRKDGTEIPLEIGFTPLRTSEGDFVLCSMVDMTERKQAEREREHLTGHLRDLAGRLIAAQEAERARLARELHDDVSQQLAGLAIELSVLSRRTGSAPRAADLLDDVKGLQQRVRRLANSVRTLSHDLHPDVLSHTGLTAALTSYCQGLSLSQPLVIDCHTQGDFASIDSAIALCLFRITQEALHNVIKHAQAEHAEVRLLRNGDILELTIMDDGRGFEIEARKRGSGLGLVSITERARLSDGTVSIVTALNEGTQIKVRVPARSQPAVGMDSSGPVATSD